MKLEDLERLSCKAYPSCSRIIAFKRLSGGINNQVFHVRTTSGDVIVKLYSDGRLGYQNRFRAETSYLRYIYKSGLCNIPKLLGSDEEGRVIVLEYIKGSPYLPGESVSQDDIRQAVLFLNSVCLKPLDGDFTITNMASEGYLGISEHIQNIEHRIAEMEVGHLPAELRRDGAFYHDECKRILAREVKKIDSDLAHGLYLDKISCKDLRVSPGDFGFHNAIKTSKGPVFIDFEHAGLDDPSKTIADFILQPRIPVAKREISSLYSLPFESCQLKTKRSASLFRVIKLKWLCIVLSVLSEDRLRQIVSVTNMSDPEEFIRERLIVASDYVD